jgi:conserved oligomeric Golgi complex subunit 5
LCQGALMPALNEIEKTVKTMVLTPLIRALNRRVASAIARLHHGAYLEESHGSTDSGSFVQKHLSGLYEQIADQHLSKLPAEYATIVASTVATFSIYTFVSNVSLVRPLGETARLHITQDLADFELSLEQLVLKAGSSMTLSQVELGKPYAELRAVRQMLFWTGLENSTLGASSIAKTMLREVWVKDVRPSTVFHFLFSFAPTLLASPHHSKRIRPEAYVTSLVQLDGSIDDGEVSAWMTTMACCDSYQQRESLDTGRDGDKRIAAILMMLGPELLRRRRH